jgi:hypothetical protein
MPRLRVTPTRLLRGYQLWAGLSALLALGMLTTILDLAKLPDTELRAANESGQRVIIDSATGAVSGLARSNEAPFEVGTGEESPQAAGSAPPAEPAEPSPNASTLPDDLVTLRTEANQVKLPEIPASRESIVAPQAPEITEKLDGMAVPKRGDKGVLPSTLYAKGFAHEDNKAMLSFVITDAGFTAATLAQIATLPREVTVAFSPYALDAGTQIALLHTGGFETWGMLPAQGARYPQDDPGPLGIIGGLEKSELQARLHKVMSATIGAVGLVLPPDETVSTQADFAAILQEIDTRGLEVLATHPNRSIEQMTSDAERQKIIRRADMVLDSTASASFVQSKLAGLKAMAEKQGKLIVVAAARPQTLSLIGEWLKTDPLGPNVVLAPLSAMYVSDAPPEEKPAAEGEAAPKEGGH